MGWQRDRSVKSEREAGEKNARVQKDKGRKVIQEDQFVK
jgi:hypothetical protein